MFFNKNKYYSKAFAKHTPSAFIVGSPFQLLCAIEAIHEFEIRDYKFVFALIKNWPRNKQMLAMANHLGVKYDLIWHGEQEDEYFDWSSKNFRIQAQGNYDRVFIADYYEISNYIIVPKYAKKGAVIAYVDDGNSSILSLNGLIKDKKPSDWRQLLRWYRKRSNTSDYFIIQRIVESLGTLGIINSQAFFSTYSNIKKCKYSVYPNTMAYVKHLYEKEVKTKRAVLIIGTVIDAYAHDIHISEHLMEGIIWKSLSEIRDQYSDYDVIYIPHGRDTNSFIQKFCELLNIHYLPLSETVETYILASDIQPIAIYGYGSTALYNFHLFYPDVEIVNFVPSDNSKYGIDEQNRVINKYYEKVGIKNQTIWINKKNRDNYVTIGSNIKSLIRIVTDRLKIQ